MNRNFGETIRNWVLQPDVPDEGPKDPGKREFGKTVLTGAAGLAVGMNSPELLKAKVESLNIIGRLKVKTETNILSGAGTNFNRVGPAAQPGSEYDFTRVVNGSDFDWYEIVLNHTTSETGWVANTGGNLEIAGANESNEVTEDTESDNLTEIRQKAKELIERYTDEPSAEYPNLPEGYENLVVRQLRRTDGTAGPIVAYEYDKLPATDEYTLRFDSGKGEWVNPNAEAEQRMGEKISEIEEFTGEKITTALPIRLAGEDKYIFFLVAESSTVPEFDLNPDQLTDTVDHFGIREYAVDGIQHGAYMTPTKVTSLEAAQKYAGMFSREVRTYATEPNPWQERQMENYQRNEFEIDGAKFSPEQDLTVVVTAPMSTRSNDWLEENQVFSTEVSYISVGKDTRGRVMDNVLFCSNLNDDGRHDYLRDSSKRNYYINNFTYSSNLTAMSALQLYRGEYLHPSSSRRLKDQNYFALRRFGGDELGETSPEIVCRIFSTGRVSGYTDFSSDSSKYLALLAQPGSVEVVSR